MKERPILFSTLMVKSLLEGRKTQTRRVVKPQPDKILHGEPYWKLGGFRDAWKPWGIKGDCLWVRETWCPYPEELTGRRWYRATDEKSHSRWRDNSKQPKHLFNWRPSIFMPRWASRITLEITNVRIERLQDITEEDAIKEGCAHTGLGVSADEIESAREQFEKLWDSINGKKFPWDSNPYVWVIEFQRRED